MLNVVFTSISGDCIEAPLVDDGLEGEIKSKPAARHHFLLKLYDPMGAAQPGAAAFRPSIQWAATLSSLVGPAWIEIRRVGGKGC